jgi:hypothetical protein
MELKLKALRLGRTWNKNNSRPFGNWTLELLCALKVDMPRTSLYFFDTFNSKKIRNGERLGGSICVFQYHSLILITAASKRFTGKSYHDKLLTNIELRRLRNTESELRMAA